MLWLGIGLMFIGGGLAGSIGGKAIVATLVAGIGAMLYTISVSSR